MLQPLQLQDVSARYPVDIAELRDFLEKAGCALESADSLGAVTARLQGDRAFRRDLTAHVWGVIDAHNHQINLSDLLGVLAIAVAGIDFAAAANEDHAQTLLRFVMQARRSFDLAPTEPTAVPVIPIARAAEPAVPRPLAPQPAVARPAVMSMAEALSAAMEPEPEPEPETRELVAEPEPESEVILHRPVPPLQDFSTLDAHAVERPRRRPFFWAAVAMVCLLLALSAVVVLHRREASDTTTVSPATAPSSASADRAAAPVPRDAVATSVTPPAPVQRGPRVVAPASSHSKAPIVRESRVIAPPTVEHQAVTVPAPAPAWTATITPPPAAPAPPPPALRTTTPVKGAIPAATLSRNLDSPSLPADAYAQDDYSPASAKGPRLLRRHPADNTELLAEVDPADVPKVPGAAFGGNNGAGGAGTVRSTSLGIMAGNVLYSPSPAYPVAASAARVQGEVTIQADIDRDGNVASARVISGPALLRDAALDAVQRWHFRPYRASGKPTPMGAMAIVDFQLPQ